ncbi:DUF1572 domain-containing protein [Sphingobacterium sp. lm-10]|uniref:DUF1572 domain-containing protein n=1 Tax=Sphingobacterium sp. lm-10 TaxID=2944904 RepID=UPI00202219D9|nr:DUF1572 domain-containing protein [Sphingobacterium sp. lm-10]MCL7987504.1 DUF1572 domain-containing protein [Sphingobacterium sp. lm-10]
MTTNYLKSVKGQFAYYKGLGDATFDQLADDQLFEKYHEESNSIAIIVMHMSGNMMSRFTDFLTTDGEKRWRNRDAEFDTRLLARTTLLENWEKGWNCLFHALDSLKDSDLNREVFIRNEAHSVMEAINRQLAHYPYHIGQIVFIGKMLCNNKWRSLSIPKGRSDAYNANLFSKPKSGTK